MSIELVAIWLGLLLALVLFLWRSKKSSSRETDS